MSGGCPSLPPRRSDVSLYMPLPPRQRDISFWTTYSTTFWTEINKQDYFSCIRHMKGKVQCQDTLNDFTFETCPHPSRMLNSKSIIESKNWIHPDTDNTRSSYKLLWFCVWRTVSVLSIVHENILPYMQYNIHAILWGRRAGVCSDRQTSTVPQASTSGSFVLLIKKFEHLESLLRFNIQVSRFMSVLKLRKDIMVLGRCFHQFEEL